MSSATSLYVTLHRYQPPKKQDLSEEAPSLLLSLSTPSPRSLVSLEFDPPPLNCPRGCLLGLKLHLESLLLKEAMEGALPKVLWVKRSSPHSKWAIRWLRRAVSLHSGQPTQKFPKSLFKYMSIDKQPSGASFKDFGFCLSELD